LPAAWEFRLYRISWCDQHLCHVNRSDHV